MRFERLLLRRFGHFTDFTLNFGQQSPGAPDLHVLYGPNEAGKSTTLAAIADLLYGINLRTPWNFLHANDVLELEATLEQAGQSIELKRFKNHWANASNQRLERFPLDLQGLSRDDYTRRFSFDEQTLQAGGEQILHSDGDVGQALFSASAGLANLKEQIDASLSEANAFWMPKKRTHLQLTDIKKALQENKKRMDRVKLDTAEWKKRCDKLAHATLRRDKHRAHRDELLQCVQQLEKRKTTLALATHYRSLVEQRDAVAAEPVVPMDHPRAADFLTAQAARHLLDKTRDQLEECRLAQAARTDLATRQQELQQQRDASKPDGKTLLLVQAAERIRALSDEGAAVDEWQKQQALHQSVVTQSAAELATARQRLSLPANSPLEQKLPGDSLLAELQRLLDEEKTLSASIEHAQEELEGLEPLPEAQELSDAVSTEESQTPDIDIASHLLRTLQQEGLSHQLASARDTLLASQQSLRTKLEKTGVCDKRLARLSLPDSHWLNGRLSDLTQGRHQLSQLNERIATLSENIRANQDRCHQLTMAGALDPAQLSAARQSRDQAWSAHEQALSALESHADLQKSARLFEQSLAHHDVLLAQAATNNQATAELQLLQVQGRALASERQELCDTQLPALQQQQLQRIEQLRSGVTGFYDAEQIDDELLRERHTLFLQLAREQELIQLQLLSVEKLELKASEQRRKLLAVLTPLQTPARRTALANLELEDLLAQAGHILESLREEAAQQREAERSLSLLAKTHATRLHQLESARKALAAWQLRWQSLTLDTLFSEMPLSRVRDALSWIASVPPEVKRHRDACRALEVLGVQLATRENAIARLLTELGEASLADALQQLNTATAQVQTYTDLQTQLKALQKKQDEIASHYALSQQAVDSLRSDLDAESDQALLALLVRTEQHRSLNDRCAETRVQLGNIADSKGDEEAIDLLSQASDADTIEQQFADANTQLGDANEQYDESSKAWALANRELEDIGDESEYARLNQHRQNLILQTMDLARRCAIARAGQKVLNAAMARFRQEHQSVILTEAQQAFTTLTGGRYVQLLPRDDGQGNERLFVIDQQHKARAVSELSTGTRYQLYLALRAAAHADYASQRPPLPFVADDIMESFDDERAGAAFQVLGRMAEKGQVIYLTHHQHLLDLARDVLGKDHVHIHHYP